MNKLLLFFVCGASAIAQTITNGAGTRVLLSQMGAPVADITAQCNTDTMLQANGSACPNELSYVNAAFAVATATTPVHLIADYPFLVNGPIIIPIGAVAYLEGLGMNVSSFVIANGSNATPICTDFPGRTSGGLNCGISMAAGTPPAQVGSLIIRDITVNGNRAGNSTGDLHCVTAWCAGILAANLEYFELTNVRIKNAPTFAVFTTNVGTQEYHNVEVDSTTASGSNTDGIHAAGPFGTINASNIRVTGYDDCIALNLPEGYSGSGGASQFANITCNGNLSLLRAYAYQNAGNICGSCTLGPVQISNFFLNGGSSNGVIIGNDANGSSTLDQVQSIQLTNGIFVTPNSLVNTVNHVGTLSFNSVRWSISGGNTASWLDFGGTSTISSFLCTACTIYANAAWGGFTPHWGRVLYNSTVKRIEMNGTAIAVESGQSLSATGYGFDIQSGSSVGSFVLTAMDPTLNPTLLNGNEWSRITNFYGAGVPAYYRNTTYGNLPPATYVGLSASISDGTSIVWGATEAGSGSNYAQLTSDGANWTVSGK
jgi:hypothetical protein